MATVWSKVKIDTRNRFSGIKNPYFDTRHAYIWENKKYSIFSRARGAKYGRGPTYMATGWSKVNMDTGNRLGIIENPYFDTQHAYIGENKKYSLFSHARWPKYGRGPIRGTSSLGKVWDFCVVLQEAYLSIIPLSLPWILEVSVLTLHSTVL